MNQEEIKFAAEVDRLGAEGLDQDEICERLGATKSQLRYRLLKAGFVWAVESRIRLALTNERFEEVLQRGEITLDDPEPAGVAA